MTVTGPKRPMPALVLISLMALATLVEAQEFGAKTQQGDTQLVRMRDSSHPTSDEDDADDSQEDFSELSLEELMSIEVTSVAGVRQPIQTTPAAMFVITADDIRRGGHQSIAEALRMVPGMSVARINSNTWAITSRGFNYQFANKLLVLIDGRSIYTPLFSGVHWDVQDMVLEDIDRIEVIRGPGATLWGANAVNGVINIVTKNTKETQGFLFSGGGGSEERGFGTLRYGTTLGENAYLRLYGKYFNRDRFVDPDDNDRPDDWDMFRGGFRLDWEGDNSYLLTLQGDAYGSDRVGEGLAMLYPTPPFSRTTFSDRRVGGGNVLLRLSHDLNHRAGWSVQTYYDRTERAGVVFDEDRDTFDVDFRHHFPVGERHAVIWGLGYRHTHDDIEGSFVLSLDPAGRSDDTYSAFVQDTIDLVRDRLSLMIGSKFEHNDFTGFEFQPGVHLAWTPDERQTLWASVARAVRTPSRVEDDFELTIGMVPFPVPTPLKALGNRDLESEDLLAYELGYRVRVGDSLLIDVAAFFNDYDDLRAAGASLANPFAVVFGNDQTGESYGIETAVTWDFTDDWRLSGGYTWFKLNLHRAGEAAEGRDPRNQFSIRSHLDITDDLEFNAAAYYVDRLSALEVPSYIRLDLGMTWRPRPNLELSIWGQNLLDDRHPEFVDPQGIADRPTEVERGVWAKIKMEF